MPPRKGAKPQPTRKRKPPSAAARTELARRESAAVTSTCGDHGGLTFYGKPCSVGAGWGTKHYGTGRCLNHDLLGASNNGTDAPHWQEKKAAFLTEYASQPKTLQRAAVSAGFSLSTLWRLRRLDPTFDEAVRELYRTVEQQQVAIVEDALFERCASPDASPVETMFFLQNRASERWKDRRRLEHTGPDGAPMETRVRQVGTFAGIEIEY